MAFKRNKIEKRRRSKKTKLLREGEWVLRFLSDIDSWKRKSSIQISLVVYIPLMVLTFFVPFILTTVFSSNMVQILV